jgi:hypothetical protein
VLNYSQFNFCLKFKTLFKTKFILVLPVFVLLLSESCNNKHPYKPSYDTAVGYVIGKETCNADTANDYWLIDVFSSSSVRQQYGDTLTLNGIKYTNLIKVSGLAEQLKKTGQKVGFDFNLADKATLSSNCTVSTPKVYQLKLAGIIRSSPASF